MTDVWVACPGCKTVGEVDEDSLGQEMRCPLCGTAFTATPLPSSKQSAPESRSGRRTAGSAAQAQGSGFTPRGLVIGFLIAAIVVLAGFGVFRLLANPGTMRLPSAKAPSLPGTSSTRAAQAPESTADAHSGAQESARQAGNQETQPAGEQAVTYAITRFDEASLSRALGRAGEHLKALCPNPRNTGQGGVSQEEWKFLEAVFGNAGILYGQHRAIATDIEQHADVLAIKAGAQELGKQAAQQLEALPECPARLSRLRDQFSALADGYTQAAEAFQSVEKEIGDPQLKALRAASTQLTRLLDMLAGL